MSNQSGAIPFLSSDAPGPYGDDVQVAALNAALAVVRKKRFGFH